MVQKVDTPLPQTTQIPHWFWQVYNRVNSSVIDGTFTVQALFTSGTNSAPGISFVGDTDTGIYRPNTNELAFATGGVGYLAIRSNGQIEQVGTNVTEPTHDIYADGGSSQVGFSATTYSTNNSLNGGTFHCRAARGSKTSPTALQSGDLIGGYGFRWCYTAGTFHTSSPTAIHCQTTENQSTTAYGSWLRLLTTPKGSTTRQERGGLTDNGTFWAHDTGTFDATSNAQTEPISDAFFVASSSGVKSGASFCAVGYGTDITPVFRGLASNGTPASPSATPADRLLVGLAGHGHSGSAFSTGSKALVGLYSAETWSGTAQGTYIEIGTTPTGSTTRTVALRIESNQSSLFSSYTKQAPVTVANLVAAGTAGAGARHFVSDATATTFASVVAGGGANNVPVYSDGTNWRIG